MDSAERQQQLLEVQQQLEEELEAARQEAATTNSQLLQVGLPPGPLAHPLCSALPHPAGGSMLPAGAWLAAWEAARFDFTAGCTDYDRMRTGEQLGGGMTTAAPTPLILCTTRGCWLFRL